MLTKCPKNVQQNCPEGPKTHNFQTSFGHRNDFLSQGSKLSAPNRTIAIASAFRVDGATSPEIPQKEEVWVQKSQPEIANRQRLSIAPLNRNAALLSLVSEIATISGVRDGHRNRKSQKSLRFRCAKLEINQTCNKKHKKRTNRKDNHPTTNLGTRKTWTERRLFSKQHDIPIKKKQP